MEHNKGTLRIGELLVEPSLDRISRDSDCGSLRPQVMELLLYLAANHGEVASSQTLLSALWDGKVVTDGTVYNCVAELRQAITALDDSQPYIETIPKRGYRLIAPVGDVDSGMPGAAIRRRVFLLAALALCVALFVAALNGNWLGAGPGESDLAIKPQQRFTIELPRDMVGFDIQHRPVTIAPDGQRIILLGVVQNRTQLYSRAIDSIEVQPIKGTENASAEVALSPDGEWIAFTAQGDHTLRKVRSTGGVPITICQPGASIWDISWEHPDYIVFDSGANNGLMRVSAQGGEPRPITFPPAGEVHKQPHQLQDGTAVLFTLGNRGSTTRKSDTIAVVSLETGVVTKLLPGASPHVTPNGLLIYFRDNALWAARFDPVRLTIEGHSVPVADDVHYDTEAHFSLSDQGTLVYVVNTNFKQRELVWVDGDGNEETLPLEPRPYISPRIAPGGDRIAVVIDSYGGADLWILSLGDATSTQLTRDESREASPVWRRDGSALYYSSDRIDNLYVTRVDSLGTIEKLTDNTDYEFAYSTTPDDTRLLFSRGTANILPGSPGKLMALEVNSKTAQRLSPDGDESEFEPAISPNGKWLAFSSLQGGQQDIYIRGFDDPNSTTWLVSQGGGSQPVWSPAGDQIFYWGPEAIMAARIQIDAEPELSKPEPVVSHQNYIFYDARNFDISPDGKRLLLVKNWSQNDMLKNRIVLAQNWIEHVKRVLLAYEAGR